jgi:hypothetical protein
MAPLRVLYHSDLIGFTNRLYLRGRVVYFGYRQDNAIYGRSMQDNLPQVLLDSNCTHSLGRDD